MTCHNSILISYWRKFETSAAIVKFMSIVWKVHFVLRLLLFYTVKSNLTLFKPFFIESHVQHRKRRLEWGQFRGQDREEKSGTGAKPEAFADPEKSSTRLHGWVREAGGWAKKTLCWIHHQISLHDTSRSQPFTLDSANLYHNRV